MHRDYLKKIKLPDAPGVYFFVGPSGKTLYIGKATSLQERVRSYFSRDLGSARGPGIVRMVEEAKSVRFEETDSVLEALLLEANLIKKHQPRYNVDAKDDKSFSYIAVTNEAFPQIIQVRGRELKKRFGAGALKRLFGPFPQGGSLKEALKIVRKIFPYRDEKCRPGQKRPCFNYQIGLCPGVCVGEVSAKEYAATVRHLLLFFSGRKKQLVKALEREMHAAARREAFELADSLKRKLFALTHIQDVALLKREAHAPHEAPSLRVEGYDTAHLGGSDAVGVMTVVEDGERMPSDYRTFHIREAKAGDDVGALREVLSRRLGHPEWPFPDIIVIDGGKAQRSAALSVLKEKSISIPVLSVVKDERHKPREILGEGDLKHRFEREALLANAEAHRFSLSKHRRLRTMSKKKRA